MDDSRLPADRSPDRYDEPAVAPPAWPTPEAGQVEVMLLGTYHMANPGQDLYNVESDEVRSPDRQQELDDLVERLADWSPDLVAVEQLASRQDSVDELYGSYRAGGERDRRSEVVQIGFRLADRLDHDRVAAVDDDVPLDAYLDGETRPLDDVPDPADVDFPMSDADERQRERRELLGEATLTAYHRYLNDADQLRLNHELLFAAALDRAAGTVGPRMLAAWYDRNLRTVQHLWRAVDTADQRVLVVFGSGHVRVLGHLLAEAPMFCPVSPLPYLD